MKIFLCVCKENGWRDDLLWHEWIEVEQYRNLLCLNLFWPKLVLEWTWISLQKCVLVRTETISLSVDAFHIC